MTSTIATTGADDRSHSVERIRAHLGRLACLHSLRVRLCASGDVGALFASAAELACSAYGFERGLVVSVDRNRLTADASDALGDDASDRLRRQVLSAPVILTHDAYEAEVIRLRRPSREPRSTSRSTLASALRLRSFALAPIVPERHALALLVVDREAPVDALDSAEIAAFGDLVAGALAHIVLRVRQQELAIDLRHLTASTQAMMRELLEAPVTLPSRDGGRPAFPLTSPLGFGAAAGLRELLSDGEARIATLLVHGRSNREIADELIVSPETVKANVARILRKLGASNRVEAVSMILRLPGPSPGELTPTELTA
jgi:DNA-binding NarL/FixJ family response regulator